MPTEKDLVAAGFGTPEQKKKDEKRRRRERQEATRAVVASSARSAPDEQPSYRPEPHTSNDDLEISKLCKQVDALKDANQDLYAKLADRDAKIEELERERDRAKDDLRIKRQEIGGINDNLSASEKALKQAEVALEKEHAAHKKTKSERDQNNAQKEDYVSLSKSQDIAIKADAEERDELRKELDNVTTDYQHAQSVIDGLEEQLEQQTREAEQAHNFLDVIRERLGQRFAEDEVDLTPETFAVHMGHLTNLETDNRHISGTSNTSSQHDGAYHSSRPSTGQRKVSIAQELANVSEYDESGDEDRSSTSTSNDIHVSKRRSRAERDSIVGTSSTNDKEKEQKVRAQAEQIEKLKAEHEREIERLREELGVQIDAQQKEIVGLNEDIANQQRYLEKSAEELERVRDERVRAANGHPVEQLNLTRDQVTKRDASTQTPTIETEERKTEEQLTFITKPAAPADLWEAFKRSPTKLQAFIVFSTLLLLFFGFSGWLKPSAYGPPIDMLRYNQAKFATVGIRSRLEDLIGYDSRLLG